MRIVHVATLVTPDGAYGGPIRVAINQLRDLQRRGHDVELVAAHRGFDGKVPTEQDGVPMRLFPAVQRIPGIGFAGIASPGVKQYLARTVQADDIVHVHLARDLVTMPAAHRMRRIARRLVVQPHGMIDESRNPLAPLLDIAMTRPVLRSADKVLYLTDIEAESLRNVAKGDLRLEPIQNGVPLREFGAEPDELLVLFLARLHPRKRATAFVEMARRLSAELPHVRFALVGPDEGDGGAVRRAIASSGYSGQISWEGALPPGDTSSRMAAASIYVLPSVGEVFPMSVLEAMALGKPVVVTNDNGLARPIEEAGAGSVVNSSVEQLTDAVRELLVDAGGRRQMGKQAYALVSRAYSMGSVSEKLERHYQ